MITVSGGGGHSGARNGESSRRAQVFPIHCESEAHGPVIVRVKGGVTLENPEIIPVAEAHEPKRRRNATGQVMPPLLTTQPGIKHFPKRNRPERGQGPAEWRSVRQFFPRIKIA